ncbi:MAG: 5'-nucleotidase C-terminal domain-containing protein [Prevotella sp.]|nr:5'-nucleotidase C-terminal domain-containing protein [Prevotella sp.]
MKRIITVCLAALCLGNQAMAQEKKVKLRIIETTDVHGCFFPYDFIGREPTNGSLARVITYVDSLRQYYGDRLLLLDNGDILQGQPTCYYCNYVNPTKENLAASVINYMKYDAQTIGNHDVETGHEVYDKWIREVKCPMLGANVIDIKTGEPYLKPYQMFERDGVRIAVLGMLTPGIPNWLHEHLWSGLRFEEMTSCARKWMSYIKEKEKPHLVIGLFHSGYDGGIVTEDYREDAALQVAMEVPGFDIVLYGHDHVRHCETIQDNEGRNVLLLDPSSNALFVGDAEVELTLKDDKVIRRTINGQISDIRRLPIDKNFMKRFQKDIDEVKHYVDRKIGKFKNTIYTRDCYFGSSAFCDFIHSLQLKLTGADISFNAPLTFNTSIKAGDVRIGDMFNLYKYENQLYTMLLTGKEILGHLEMSYDLWVNTMKNPNDHIMLLDEHAQDDQQRRMFKNLAFNFDSAAGIDYEVDVTKPNGQKVRILRMSNGEPFDINKTYKVAMNSYRGNGGGLLLTQGAGIPRDKLKDRVIWESDRDQRFYLTQLIEQMGECDPQPFNNWRFVPEDWAKPAIERDRRLLFK